MLTLCLCAGALLLGLLGLVEVYAEPSYHVYGCNENNVSAGLPFCDHSLPIDERVNDLIGRLTLDEKLGILGADGNSGVNSCNMMDHGVERLGIPPYMNLVETNSAVAAKCVEENICATNFPSPALFAASFNRSLWQQKGTIMSDELRALNNFNWMRGTGAIDYIGLTGFGPNINLMRDPRWGRNSEVPSEDPLLSGTYAAYMLRGMQFGDDPKYLKMIAGLKHYLAYSVEDGRETFIPNITDFDLWDTYLMQYKIGFGVGDNVDGLGLIGGNASAVMSSYAGLNGVPASENSFIVQDILRSAWARDEVVVATDCGAIANSEVYIGYAKDAPDAAAKALNAGTDLDLGDMYYPPVANGGNGGLPNALEIGLTTESQVESSLRRVFTARMLAGLFDPIDKQQYTKIPITTVNASEHHDFVLEATQQGLVLLKNTNNILPFKKGKKLAVIGPHTYSQRDLFESYLGDELCVEGGYDCIETIASTFSRLNNGATEEDDDLTIVRAGVDINGNEVFEGSYEDAVNAAKSADQVIVVVGLGNEIEYEPHDRIEINLPGLQEQLTLDILAIGLPAVIVMINGGAVSLETIESHSDAMIEAFYPGRRGPLALFQAIFGDTNRFGKLPYTIYESDFINEQDMRNFDMTSPPGRTYRYYQNPVTFEFGHGLSYTTFSISCDDLSEHEMVVLNCFVTNSGQRDGDEVLMVYHSPSESLRSRLKHPAPVKTLVDYARVYVPFNITSDVTVFSFPLKRLALTNNKGDKAVYAGTHIVTVTNGLDKLDFDIIIDETVVYPSM